jgi:hypothetical protein
VWIRNFSRPWALHLVRGRNFLPGEEGVVIITEAAAQVLWRDEDALGKSLPWDGQGGAPGPAVVGVVANASTTLVGNPSRWSTTYRNRGVTRSIQSCCCASRAIRTISSGVFKTPRAPGGN